MRTAVTIIIALLLSTGAYFGGRYADQQACSLARDAAGIPGPDVVAPKEPPPVEQQPKIRKLGGNPFEKKGGILVPKDPVRREKHESAEVYVLVNRIASFVIWAAPAFGLFLIALRAMNQRMDEQKPVVTSPETEVADVPITPP